MDKFYDGSAREPFLASERHGELDNCANTLNIPAGEERCLTLNVHNLSRTAWAFQGAYPVRLGAHLLTPNDETVQADLLRAALTANLHPGEQDAVDLYSHLSRLAITCCRLTCYRKAFLGSVMLAPST